MVENIKKVIHSNSLTNQRDERMRIMINLYIDKLDRKGKGQIYFFKLFSRYSLLVLKKKNEKKKQKDENKEGRNEGKGSFFLKSYKSKGLKNANND